MKNYIRLTAAIAVVAFTACKKDYNNIVTPQQPAVSYSSPQQFLNSIKPQPTLHTVSGTSGGSFTTNQGTIVTVPANAFVDNNNNPVTGPVTIKFLDLYKKSDMLLCDKPTTYYTGAPLKSAGEFYIEASANNQQVWLAAGQQIDVMQPLQANAAMDTAMIALAANDSTGFNWMPDPDMTLVMNQSQYVFSLYQFNTPADSGSWCNSDNPYYFSAYPQTLLTLNPTDSPMDYQTDVFLVFSGVNSMVHVYRNYSTNADFPYAYAPVGLSCTVVAIGVKDGQLYSSFTPITISANQTVNFTLGATTVTDFQAQLNALN